MNRVVLMGRLTRDPDVRYTQTDQPMAIARYTLAVDRRRKQQDGQQNADFISCVAFGKAGEFAEKYLHKGTKITISGRIQTGSYVKQDGTKVYTTDVVVEDHEFVESKGNNGGQSSTGTNTHATPQNGSTAANNNDLNGFMDIPDSIDEELPFQ